MKRGLSNINLRKRGELHIEKNTNSKKCSKTFGRDCVSFILKPYSYRFVGQRIRDATRERTNGNQSLWLLYQQY